MLKAGLTGGYATGKSLIARRLAALGAYVIYADQLGHDVLLPGGEAYQPTVSSFGNSILQADGTIDRKKLAAIVFSQPDRLKELNAIVHPAVFRLEEQALIGFERQNRHGIAVIEAAILIETGRYKTFDCLIVTTCPREIQVERAMQRDHVSRKEAETRIARQLPDADRVRFANHVIDTGGTPEETVRQVNTVFTVLRQLAEESAP